MDTTMTTLFAISEALAAIDGYTLCDIGPTLTCLEAEGLAEALRLLGRGDDAETLIVAHAEADDSGDMHGPDETGGDEYTLSA